MSYTLTRQKKYITGEASEEAFATLIKIAIAPQDLVDLLFDRTLDDDRWKCQLNDKGALDRCQNKANTQISIAWSERTAERRMIEIDSPQARVSMSLKESPSKVQITDELFELPVPDGFKTTTL